MAEGKIEYGLRDLHIVRNLGQIEAHQGTLGVVCSFPDMNHLLAAVGRGRLALQVGILYAVIALIAATKFARFRLCGQYLKGYLAWCRILT